MVRRAVWFHLTAVQVTPSVLCNTRWTSLRPLAGPLGAERGLKGLQGGREGGLTSSAMMIEARRGCSSGGMSEPRRLLGWPGSRLDLRCCSSCAIRISGFGPPCSRRRRTHTRTQREERGAEGGRSVRPVQCTETPGHGHPLREIEHNTQLAVHVQHVTYMYNRNSHRNVLKFEHYTTVKKL